MIIDNIICLTYLDSQQIGTFTKWHTCQEFLLFQIQNTKIMVEFYNQFISVIYHELGLSTILLNKFVEKSSKINQERPLTLIHGDRHKLNMIQNNSKITFIDWELGCLGDIVYDIAFHLHQMAYTDEDRSYFIRKMKLQIPNQQKFTNEELELYETFILLRSTLYHVYWTYAAYKNRENWKSYQLSHFTRRYNRLAKKMDVEYQAKSEFEIDQIFERLVVNINHIPFCWKNE